MKVWLYYRLSRDEDKELNSLSNQRNIIYHYAITNGHEVVGESFDDNVSGMYFNRAGIDKIYEVVEAGLIEAIVVKDLHTPEALPGIIEALLKDGYTLVPVSELILPGTYNTDYTIDHTGRQMPCSTAAG